MTRLGGALVMLCLALSACTATRAEAPTSAGAPSSPSSPRTPTPPALAPATTAHVFDVVLPHGEPRRLGATEVALGDAVPWSRVGDGWHLSLLSQETRHADVVRRRADLLDLVAPSGGRYQLFKTDQVGWQLQDWSRNGRTALVSRARRGGETQLVEVDLRTGDQRAITVRHVYAALLRADGAGLWVTDGDRRVRSIGWDGALTAYDTGGVILQQSDGTLVTGGSHRGSQVIDTTGTTHPLATPGPLCRPVRWWDDAEVLETCMHHGSAGLVVVPLDGTPVSWISARHPKSSYDLGDVDAWTLDGVTYLRAEGACGYEFLGRQEPDGSVTNINPPHAIGNVTLVGVTDHRLLVTHLMGCELPGPEQVLGAFDPDTRAETVLARLPEGEDFGRFLTFAAPVAVGW